MNQYQTGRQDGTAPSASTQTGPQDAAEMSFGRAADQMDYQLWAAIQVIATCRTERAHIQSALVRERHIRQELDGTLSRLRSELAQANSSADMLTQHRLLTEKQEELQREELANGVLHRELLKAKALVEGQRGRIHAVETSLYQAREQVKHLQRLLQGKDDIIKGLRKGMAGGASGLEQDWDGKCEEKDDDSVTEVESDR